MSHRRRRTTHLTGSVTRGPSPARPKACPSHRTRWKQARTKQKQPRHNTQGDSWEDKPPRSPAAELRTWRPKVPDTMHTITTCGTC
eukprot:1898703-Prymnesium_polylepis.1